MNAKTYTIDAATGRPLPPDPLGFACSSVAVDNFSNQWLFLADAPKYVPPGQVNLVVAVQAVRRALATFQAPPGIVQQPLPTGIAQITFLEAPQPAQAGSSSGGAGASTVVDVQLQSVSDPRLFTPVVDHRRYQAVPTIEQEYSEVQVGRLLYRDDYEAAAIQWSQVSGTVASDTATFIVGSRSLKLTAAAGAGNQATARKFFQLAADQFFSTFPVLVVDVWFKPFDVNWRDVQLFLRPDDTTVRYQSAIRVWNQQAGVAQAQFQYLDSTGTFQNVNRYLTRAGGGSVGDAWHHLMLAMNYLQGTSGGYFTYALAKYDDFTWRPTTTTGAQVLTTGNVRETAVDLIVSGDNASAAVVNWDQFLLADLSSVFQL